jgi:hypothetical protein
MLGWLVTIAVLLCASCVGPDDADPAALPGPPAAAQGARGAPPEVPDDDNPCRRACVLAAVQGCVNVSALCAEGGWPLFAVVGGIGILCSKAMVAACGGSTGVPTCQAACSQ